MSGKEEEVPSSCTVKHKRALYEACKSDNVEKLKGILEEVGQECMAEWCRKQRGVSGTLVHWTSRCGKADSLEFLLSRVGCDPNVFNRNRETPLHCAVAKNHLDAVDPLLEYGAKIDAGNRKWESPLHLACKSENFEMVKLLLKRHAMVDRKDKRGMTPLACLCSNSRNVRLLKLLLEFGADANTMNNFNESPMFLVCSRDKGCRDLLPLARILVEHGANVNTSDEIRGQKTPLHMVCKKEHRELVEFLLDHGVVLDVYDKSGRTPLAIAHCCTSPDIFHLLLRRGAFLLDNSGRSVLHEACKGGNEDLFNLILQQDGVNYNPRDKIRATPLYYACQKGHFEFVQRLLQHGADVEAGRGWRTPLHAACCNGHTDLIGLLLKLGANPFPITSSNLMRYPPALTRERPFEVVAGLGNLPAVLLFLRYGVDIESTSYIHLPFFYACKMEQLDVINLMLYRVLELEGGERYT